MASGRQFAARRLFEGARDFGLAPTRFGTGLDAFFSAQVGATAQQLQIERRARLIIGRRRKIHGQKFGRVAQLNQLNQDDLIGFASQTGADKI